MDDLVKRLEDEIWQQIRNGRDTVYIDVNDLRKLGIYITEEKQGREFVDLKILQPALQRYKFKENLKYNGNNISYRQFMKELKDLEKGNDDKCK